METILEIDRYSDAITCLKQILQEGKKETNVDLQLMLSNITRCESIVRQLQPTENDPVYRHALSSLICSLTANKDVLTRKIWQLNNKNKNTYHHNDQAQTYNDSGDAKDKEKRSRQLCIEETILQGSSISLSDVVGLSEAKQALQEAIVMPLTFPHLFSGGRKPWKRILLYGPPGTGKSRLAQAIASEIKSTFYSVSSADLVSSWVGESEKLIKELFCHANGQPGKSVIFIDEIDSICRQRCAREDEHTRRIKTELLKQMEGADNSSTSEEIFLMCATNCPWDLDSAFLRRFQKRIYIPLPDREARIQLMQLHSQATPLKLTPQDWEKLADNTNGYSGSDLATLTLGALFQPIRDLQQASHWIQFPDGHLTPCSPDHQDAIAAKLYDLPSDKVIPREVQLYDFLKSIATHSKTVCQDELKRFQDFAQHFVENI